MPLVATASVIPVVPSPPRPELLAPQDLVSSVRAHLEDVQRCYIRQLRAHPSWSGRAIVDLAILRSGRVGDVSVSPASLAEQPLGRCLLRRIPRWRFPPFSGEIASGVTQGAIPTSFAFRFNSS